MKLAAGQQQNDPACERPLSSSVQPSMSAYVRPRPSPSPNFILFILTSLCTRQHVSRQLRQSAAARTDLPTCAYRARSHSKTTLSG